MKAFKLNLFSLIMVSLLFGSLQLYAQQESPTDQNKIVIIKKYTDENGVTTIEKIIKDGDELDDLNIRSLEEEFNFNKDLDESLKNIHIDVDKINGETVIKIENLSDEVQRSIQEGLEDINWNFDSDDDDYHFSFNSNSSCNSKKPFLGVVIDNTSGEGNGIRISKVVNNSAAEAAGLEEGDVISAINGKRIDDFSDLSNALDRFEPNDNITVSYFRNGQAMEVNARLKTKSESNNHSGNHFNFNWDNNDWVSRSYRSPCKPFIGINIGGRSSEGVRVSSIIDGTPADEVDLEGGDIIVALDGVEVGNFNELLKERNKHSAGDYFTLSYLRDGELRSVEAQFPSCDEEEKEEEESPMINQSRQERMSNDTPQNFNTAPSRVQNERMNNTLELEEMLAFPNPTDGDITIQFRGESVPTVVTIIDAVGREIMRETINNFSGVYNEELNLDEATPGTLFINIQQGEKIYTEKIILTNGF